MKIWAVKGKWCTCFSLFTFRFSLHQTVILIWENNPRLKRFCFFKIQPGVTNNDEDIPYLYPAGGGTVEANHARASFTFDDVGFEAFTIVVVDDLHAFALNEVGCVQQVFINGDAADVVQVGLRDLNPVNFGFESLDQHRVQR